MHHVSPQAEGDLDRIWQYIREESVSDDIATGRLTPLASACFFWPLIPRAARARDDDLGPGRRSFPADSYVIVYRIEGKDVLILRVAHSRQGIRALMRRTGEGR